MSPPETPRERALRLWEAAGYARAAYDAACAASKAAKTSTFAALDSAHAVAYDASVEVGYGDIPVAESRAAVRAGEERYRREHP